MLWAALVAVGVAMVTMAVLAARLTRKPELGSHDDFEPEADPNDPWSAWRPRPFEEHEHRPRPRAWPLLGALTGLVLIGSGIAGARQGAAPPRTEVLSASGDTTPAPVTLEVTVTPSPTPIPTEPPATARPVVTAKPQVTATAPVGTTAPAGPGPTISGTASCSAGKLTLNYSVTAQGSTLSWIGVYADGKAVKGGPASGTSFSGTYSQSATPGDHALEVTAQDKTGKTNRKQWQAHCA